MRALLIVMLVAACEGGSTAPDAGISSAQKFGACNLASWGVTEDWVCSRACEYDPTTSAMDDTDCEGTYVAPNGELASRGCDRTFMYAEARGCCYEDGVTMRIAFVQCQ